jgi:hypothetical protein
MAPLRLLLLATLVVGFAHAGKRERERDDDESYGPTPALLCGVPRHGCARYEPNLHCALPLPHNLTHGRTRPSPVSLLRIREEPSRALLDGAILGATGKTVCPCLPTVCESNGERWRDGAGCLPT